MSLSKKLRNLRHAGNGIAIMWHKEVQFFLQVAFGILAFALAVALDVSSIEFLLLISSVVYLIASEILNTAIEILCDKLHPAHDAEIGKVKDLAGTFVIVSYLPLIIACAVIFGPRLFLLL